MLGDSSVKDSALGEALIPIITEKSISRHYYVSHHHWPDEHLVAWHRYIDDTYLRDL